MNLPDHETNEIGERNFNDRLAERYFDIWDSYPVQIFTNRVEQDLLAEHAAPDSDVLVIGVGGGRELPVLIELGCRIVAIDVSDEMLRIGRERYADSDSVVWRNANANALPDDLGTFDVCVAYGGVVNYVIDLTSVLSGIRSHLRPRGQLVLDCFNREFSGEQAEIIQDNGRVRRSYSAAELRSACEEAGYSTIDVAGHRYLVDHLPPTFNSQPDGPGADVLARVLELEPELSRLAPVEQAKMLTLVARN